ncbi:cation efflux family-domain-containing protein [Infundibulicybe gibba]|nr:cation efflux family-domain-containing protein [Infundibulicybe gibba]
MWYHSATMSRFPTLLHTPRAHHGVSSAIPYHNYYYANDVARQHQWCNRRLSFIFPSLRRSNVSRRAAYKLDLPITNLALHLHRQLHTPAISMSLRRPYSTEQGRSPMNGSASRNANTEHEHHDGHEHEHEHDHEHAHSIFGHSHSHGEGHNHGAEIMDALQGGGDRGSRITLIGLYSNVCLTAAKGVAGWYLHSASLFADAGHSLSDLLGDFVTLFCWKLSRKPPSREYPYGFAKFETLGTTTISLLLIGGALGIGFHSYHLLIAALGHTAASLDTGPLKVILENITSVAPDLPVVGHSHAHAHAVDPNAAWFAASGVLVKEWLYRITKKVADEENSPVLTANAIHHRSDAYSSIVAFFAILGTWFFPAIPLDPLGGLLVSIVILRQGIGLFVGAWGDLTDAGVSPRILNSMSKALKPLRTTSSADDIVLGDIHHLRARRAGSLMFVDVTVNVPGTMNAHDMSILEDRVESTLKAAKREITEVRVKFQPVDSTPA